MTSLMSFRNPEFLIKEFLLKEVCFLCSLCLLSSPAEKKIIIIITKKRVMHQHKVSIPQSKENLKKNKYIYIYIFFLCVT